MKNAIITGANSGLGFEVAKKIAADRNYRVILACRNEEKANAARDSIIAETGNQNVVFMKLDTSLLSSVRAFAKEYAENYKTLDVLINNAGISSMRSGTTEEGFELVFATNYLGHYLLTRSLLPFMTERARIVNVTSDMHNPPGGIEWKSVDELAHPSEEDRKKYAYSKLCAIYFTHELDRRLKEQGSNVTVNSFNPGFMADTNFSGGHADKARSLLVKTTMPDRYGKLSTSSDALAKIATDGAFEGVSGEYFDRSTNAKKSSPLSYNEKNEKELWQKSEEYCEL